MKKLFVSAGFLFLLVLFYSCEKDNTYTSVIGTWQCVEVSTINAPNPYLVDISREVSDSTQIKIANFYNMGYSKEIYAKIVGFDITIQSNLYGFNIVGEGKVASDYKTIDWQYQVDDGSGLIDYVTATYTRN